MTVKLKSSRRFVSSSSNHSYKSTGPTAANSTTEDRQTTRRGTPNQTQYPASRPQDGHGLSPRDICCWIRNRGGRGVRDQFAEAGCGLYLCCSAAVARGTMNDDRELAAALDI